MPLLLAPCTPAVGVGEQEAACTAHSALGSLLEHKSNQVRVAVRGQVPGAWREHLAGEGVRSGRSRTFKEAAAADGTRKFLQQLADGHVVETVGIPLDDEDQRRLTCCVSSQACLPV